ncbi:MAG: DUF58 domain-containing protein, partial [Bifidobacteriaceae bacterium]|nr:DUF58 domain-containing protein [Bifidobacteriaceae bacterium]
MIKQSALAAQVRKKIENLYSSLSLPTAQRTLAGLEGVHTSHKKSGNEDIANIRAYETSDEARLIDWKASARSGRPMVIERERPSQSQTWLLFDTGQHMRGICQQQELAFEIAANALCMFALLTIRSGDDISMVFGNAHSITRVPFHGSFAQFEHVFDNHLDTNWQYEHNIEALLSYARSIKNPHALIVLATDEHSIKEEHLEQIKKLASTHP